MLIERGASRAASLAVLLVAATCACGSWALDFIRRSDENALQAARTEIAATARLLASMNGQAGLRATGAPRQAKPRDAQVAEIYGIAAAEKLQVLGADVETDPADSSSYTIDVRMRGAYPNAKKLVAQVLQRDEHALVRNFSVRRLASGTELEMRVLFEVAG